MIVDEIRKQLRVAMRKKAWEDYEEILVQAASQIKGWNELSYYQGILFIYQQDTENGLELLREAMVAAEERNNFPLAMSAASRIASVEPNNLDVRLRRSDLYIAMGLVSAAYEYLLREFDFYRRRNDANSLYYIVKKIISIDPTNLDLALKMAKILARLGRKDEVRRVVESAVFSLQGQGKYDEAAQIQTEYRKLYEEL
ncbi:hypothetical protein GF359_08165 [candidate division WOR-3 bacterium]|uniref:Tetratricopeptide repeat protein n=1 Tax=candidate division WOR-3 bacterium TaxID=2052148 RepID=A0A9D5QEM5_UNCW3|nr:hypothetical protein [candidate division WOR-3 bacterium]MBD3365175.1 hypothetical protein [candidate division WOR-3 bacterium]